MFAELSRILMSLTEDMDPGASLELWRCNILPRMCLLLWDQTEWVMPPQSLQVDSGRWPSCFCIQLLKTNLQSMFYMSKPRSVWIILPPVFSWQLLFQAIKKETKAEKTVLLKKADCVCSARVPFLGQMLGRIVKMDWGQAVFTVASCLPSADKLFYHLKETVLNPLSMDSGTS